MKSDILTVLKAGWQTVLAVWLPLLLGYGAIRVGIVPPGMPAFTVMITALALSVAIVRYLMPPGRRLVIWSLGFVICLIAGEIANLADGVSLLAKAVFE